MITRARALPLLLAAAAAVLAAPAGAASPPRPGPDDGSNFYVLVGADRVDLDLDPRGADAFVDAGLDPRDAATQGFLGVGWVFAAPLRLDLLAGGGRLTIDRPDVECSVGRVSADLHLALLETSLLALEATASLGFQGIVYSGLPEDEPVPGGEVGLGATLRVGLPGPLGLAATYRWQHSRFQRTTIELEDGAEVNVHPTGAFHSARVLLLLDL